jgi:hypothetical protein
VLTLVAATYVFWPSAHHRAIGAGVIAESTNLRGDLHAQVAASVRLPYTNADLITPVGKIYQIGPSGGLPASTSLTLPFPQKVTVGEDELLLAMTAESPTDTWVPVLKLDSHGKPTAQPAVTLAPDGMSATLVTNHLSLYTFVKVKLGKVAAIVKDVAGKVVGGIKDVLNMAAQTFNSLTADLFAHATPPTCTGVDQAKADNYQFQPDGKDTVLSCFGYQNGQRIVKLVNNRTYPLLVHHTGFTVVDDGPSFRLRLSQLSKLVSGPDTVLFPNETAVFGVNLQSGGSAELTTEFSGMAQSLYSLEIGLRLALLFLTNLGSGTGVAAGGGTITDEMPMLDMLDKALNVTDCGSLLADNQSLDFGEVLNRCASPSALLTMFGKRALILAPIMVVAPVIAYFKSQFNALGDQFNQRDRSTITVTRVDTTVLCPSGTCAAIAQADIDGDRQPDTVTLSIDPSFQDSREYVVTAKLATGKVVSGTLNFDNGGALTLDGTWQLTDLSFVGSSQVNGLPGDEIVVKLHYTSHDNFWTTGTANTWAIGMLTYIGGDELLIPNVGNGDFPYYVYDPGTSEWSAQGFRCAKASDGSPLLDMWRVSVEDSNTSGNHEYSLSQEYYRPDDAPQSQYNWRISDHGDEVQNEVPLTDRAALKAKIAELSNTGCPGLPQLPLPDYSG